MSPEQALGEVDHMDERVDVFGLGDVCEILTGKPPYFASRRNEVFRLAMRGKLDACHDRLQKSDADRDLVDLATECLSPEPDSRPRHAGIVAQRVSSYLASVESRLRAAESSEPPRPPAPRKPSIPSPRPATSRALSEPRNACNWHLPQCF